MDKLFAYGFPALSSPNPFQPIVPPTFKASGRERKAATAAAEGRESR